MERRFLVVNFSCAAVNMKLMQKPNIIPCRKNWVAVEKVVPHEWDQWGRDVACLRRD